MSLSGLIGSEWATTRNNESDYQSYTVSLAGGTEIDVSNEQESHRQAQGRTSYVEPVLPPTTDDQFEYEGRYCRHPWGDRHCHLHYPFAINIEGNTSHDVDSDSVYLGYDSNQLSHSRSSLASGIGYNSREERRAVSMPLAVERYVHDYQNHEVLATRLRRHDPHVNEVKARKPYHEKKSSQAGSKKDSKGGQKNKGAGSRHLGSEEKRRTTG